MLISSQDCCHFLFLSSNAVVGESALDRLACGLGGKTVLQHITTNVPPMLANRKSRGCLTFALAVNVQLFPRGTLTKNLLLKT